jgi:hypothetical protein
MDNDGWPDIYVSVHVRQNGVTAPLVLRNEGGHSPAVRFSSVSFTVADDGLRDRGYGAAGPTVDFDRDGRLDALIAEWWSDRPAVLYRNTTRSGNYLDVTGLPIGTRIEIFHPGRMGSPEALLGRTEIMTGYGYSSGQETAAHFGLGGHDTVDLRALLPHGGATIERPGAIANRRLTISSR